MNHRSEIRIEINRIVRFAIMASASGSPLLKRRKTVRRVDNDQVLCVLPILVLSQPIPYFVCEANRGIIKRFITFLMGNNVEFDVESELDKAIDYFFERDHEHFLLLWAGKIKVKDFGPRFVPLVFFSKTPDVLVPEEFANKWKSFKISVKQAWN